MKLLSLFALVMLLLETNGQSNEYLIYQRSLIKREQDFNEDSILIAQKDTTFFFLGIINLKKNKLFFQGDSHLDYTPIKAKLKEIEGGYSVSFWKQPPIKASFNNPFLTDTTYSWFLVPFGESLNDPKILFKNGFTRLIPKPLQTFQHETLNSILIESCPEVIVTSIFDDYSISIRRHELEYKKFTKYRTSVNIGSAIAAGPNIYGSLITLNQDNYQLYFLGYPGYVEYVPEQIIKKDFSGELKQLTGTWIQDDSAILKTGMTDDLHSYAIAVEKEIRNEIEYQLNISENHDCTFTKTTNSDSVSSEVLSGKVEFSPSGKILIFRPNNSEYPLFWNIIEMSSETLKLAIETKTVLDFNMLDYQVQIQFVKKRL